MRAIVAELHGTPRLMATLLYGSGLRLLECCRLRVQDIDFGMNQIVVRDGKGAKDRVTILPIVTKNSLAQHLRWVKRQHDADLARGAGWVELPWALACKYEVAESASGVVRVLAVGRKRRGMLTIGGKEIAL